MNKHYITAGCLAAFTAVACIAESRVFPLAVLPLLGVALLAVFYVLARMRVSVDEKLDSGPRRPTAMAALWYGLSIVLAVSLLREPARALWLGETAHLTALAWIVAAVGVVVIGLALFGLLQIARRR